MNIISYKLNLTRAMSISNPATMSESGKLWLNESQTTSERAHIHEQCTRLQVGDVKPRERPDTGVPESGHDKYEQIGV